MAQVKFGASQLKNPTPSRWGNAVKVFTVLASTLLAWVGTADFIPLKTSGVVQSILGLLIAISNGLLPFLGVETTQTNVPIEDVASMKADDNK